MNVFAKRQRLDALCFPQMRAWSWGALHGGGRIHETTVSEINIAGLPGVTMPAGYYAVRRALLPDLRRAGCGASPSLLAYAFAYEQATRITAARLTL